MELIFDIDVNKDHSFKVCMVSKSGYRSRFTNIETFRSLPIGMINEHICFCYPCCFYCTDRTLYCTALYWKLSVSVEDDMFDSSVTRSVSSQLDIKKIKIKKNDLPSKVDLSFAKIDNELSIDANHGPISRRILAYNCRYLIVVWS